MSLLLATYQWRHKTVILKKKIQFRFFFLNLWIQILLHVLNILKFAAQSHPDPDFDTSNFLFFQPPLLWCTPSSCTHTHTLFSHLKPDYNLEVKKNFFCQLCMNKQKWNLKVTFYAFVVKTAKTFFLRICWQLRIFPKCSSFHWIKWYDTFA